MANAPFLLNMAPHWEDFSMNNHHASSILKYLIIAEIGNGIKGVVKHYHAICYAKYTLSLTPAKSAHLTM